tara:strand:+ start:522 stop:839 length:318 start_codon:yes stop_codon:yes gene_type:complete
MIKKKIVFGLFVVTFLSGCAAPTAMIGPAYTLGSTGNVLQTGFSYGSSKLVKSYTGKTTVENLKDVASSVKSKNIKKKTLESDEFYLLVKNKIEKTSGILNLSNQ